MFKPKPFRLDQFFIGSNNIGKIGWVQISNWLDYALIKLDFKSIISLTAIGVAFSPTSIEEQSFIGMPSKWNKLAWSQGLPNPTTSEVALDWSQGLGQLEHNALHTITGSNTIFADIFSLFNVTPAKPRICSLSSVMVVELIREKKFRFRIQDAPTRFNMEKKRHGVMVTSVW